MIRLLNKEYDGYIADNGDETITVVLHTWEGFDDIAEAMVKVTTIENVAPDGTSTVYTITTPVSAKVVGQNLYSIVFSMKPTPTMEMQQKLAAHEETIQDMSDLIDDLLIDSLEG